jgi:uncharacterized protein (DUF1499 family)
MILRFMFVLAVLFVFTLLALARLSMASPRMGLKNGRLMSCPGSPNCVNTEYQTELAISFPECTEHQAWLHLADSIEALGGHLIMVEENYLWSEFHSRWLGFVDDVEARLDKANNVIHLRSASRVGYSDFGVNRRRINRIRTKMLMYLETVTIGDTQKCKTLS